MKTTERERQAARGATVYTVVSTIDWKVSVTCYAPSAKGALCVAQAEFPGVIWATVIRG